MMVARKKQIFLVGFITSFVFSVIIWTQSSANSFIVLRAPKPAVVFSVPQSPEPKEGEYTLIRHLSTIEARFSHRTDPQCDNTCPPTIPACNATTMKDWENLFLKNQIRAIPLFSPTEYMFPFELNYRKDSPLEDIKTLPSLSKSQIFFVSQFGSKSHGKDVVLSKNVPAKFRVILLDDYGHDRQKGGDEVRAWLTGRKDNKTAAIAADIEDYHNGTYGVSVTVPWTGPVKLHVTVTYPREYFRAAINHHRLGAHRIILGKFRRGNVTETTICHSTPNIPGRPCVCNMTRWNGIAYYCGRPKDKRLSCKDTPFMASGSFPLFRNLTQAEVKLDEISIRKPSKVEIKHELNITVKEGREEPYLPPCFKSSPRLTWAKTHKKGYWSGKGVKVWESQICRERKLTSEWAKQCLNSTTVWMMGDSQIREMVTSLDKVLNCRAATTQWPYLCHCKNETLDTILHYRPHRYPLYLSNLWIPFMNNGNETEFLANIPSKGDHIVVLHFFLHFASSHLSVLRQRLRIIKEAVAKLLERNPSVLVFIRGPHTAATEWKYNHMYGGDIFGAFMQDLYIEIFSDLQDKIYFLDSWGMSISMENLFLHPPRYFFQSQWRTILSYKCE